MAGAGAACWGGAAACWAGIDMGMGRRCGDNLLVKGAFAYDEDEEEEEEEEEEEDKEEEYAIRNDDSSREEGLDNPPGGEKGCGEPGLAGPPGDSMDDAMLSILCQGSAFDMIDP